MKAVRRLFSSQHHLNISEPTRHYQGMASEIRRRLDISSRYDMNSGYEIPILGFGVGFLLLPQGLIGLAPLHASDMALFSSDMFLPCPAVGLTQYRVVPPRLCFVSQCAGWVYARSSLTCLLPLQVYQT